MAIGQQPRKATATAMATPADSPSPQMQRGRSFLHEVMVELKKTTWPTLPEAWRLTVVVLAVVVGIGVYVGVTDAILSRIFNFLIK